MARTIITGQITVRELQILRTALLAYEAGCRAQLRLEIPQAPDRWRDIVKKDYRAVKSLLSAIE